MKRTAIIRKTPMRRSWKPRAALGTSRGKGMPAKIRTKAKRKASAPWKTTHRDGREVLNLDTAQGMREYRDRVRLMLIRQHGICCLVDYIGACPGPLQFEDAEYEHEKGKGMGGSRRDDRIVLPDGTLQNGASCHFCNTAKGSRRISYNASVR